MRVVVVAHCGHSRLRSAGLVSRADRNISVSDVYTKLGRENGDSGGGSARNSLQRLRRHSPLISFFQDYVACGFGECSFGDFETQFGGVADTHCVVATKVAGARWVD